jgi:hypothetical protein
MISPCGAEAGVGSDVLERLVPLVDDVRDLSHFGDVLRVVHDVGRGEAELREVGIVRVLLDAIRNVVVPSKDHGDDEVPGVVDDAEERSAFPGEEAHALELPQAVLVAFVPGHVDDDHAYALADGLGEVLVVGVAGLRPVVVDGDVFVDQSIEFRLEGRLELIDEPLHEVTLTVTVADEARVPERHENRPPDPEPPARRGRPPPVKASRPRNREAWRSFRQHLIGAVERDRCHPVDVAGIVGVLHDGVAGSGHHLLAPRRGEGEAALRLGDAEEADDLADWSSLSPPLGPHRLAPHLIALAELGGGDEVLLVSRLGAPVPDDPVPLLGRAALGLLSFAGDDGDHDFPRPGRAHVDRTRLAGPADEAAGFRPRHEVLDFAQRQLAAGGDKGITHEKPRKAQG